MLYQCTWCIAECTKDRWPDLWNIFLGKTVSPENHSIQLIWFAPVYDSHLVWGKKEMPGEWIWIKQCYSSSTNTAVTSLYFAIIKCSVLESGNFKISSPLHWTPASTLKLLSCIIKPFDWYLYLYAQTHSFGFYKHQNDKQWLMIRCL